MKMLESVIWLTDELKQNFDTRIQSFIPVIKGQVCSSLRMPFNDNYVWYYHLLNYNIHEEYYLYKHMEEQIMSHVFLLENDTPETLEQTERQIAEFTANFSEPPLVIIHFLGGNKKVDNNIQKTAWKTDNNIYLTWHQKYLPLKNWNNIGLDYYKKILAKPLKENGQA